MTNIIVVLPKLEEAKGVKSILVRSGFQVTGICTTGTQAISQADGLNDGIVICSYKLADMIYTELHEDLPEGFEMLPLPGHFFGMVGYRTPDGVVYLADCLASRQTLDKYQISFIYDVGAYLDTLERVKALRAVMFIPAHAEPAEDIAPLAQYNIGKVWEIADKIVSLCEEPLCFENLLQKVFSAYGLAMDFEDVYKRQNTSFPSSPVIKP